MIAYPPHNSSGRTPRSRVTGPETPPSMTGLLRNVVLGLGLVVYGVVKRWRTGAWRNDLRTRNGHVSTLVRRGSGPRLLVHGVSVGETNALEPLVGALARSDAEPDVVVSASTETGYSRARKVHDGAHAVVRYPLDFTWMVERFLDDLRPDLVVLAELELWPTFMATCRKRGIPVTVVNGRLSDRSHRGYRRAGPLFRRMFQQLSFVCAQTETYRQRFVSLGVLPDRAVVSGNLKWDAARARPDPAAAQALVQSLGIDSSRPLVVAGSTGPGEEEELIAARPPACQLLLAPRSQDRWDDVARLVPGMPRRSRGNSGTHPVGHDVFLLDTIGELVNAYSLADAVFVGRSLVPLGGSNPLESIALGKPTVLGPHYENFESVVAELLDTGGLVVSREPMRVVEGWLTDPASARTVVDGGRLAFARNEGNAARMADQVLRCIHPPTTAPRSGASPS